MNLDKFPVVTLRESYWVRIKEKYYALGTHFFRVKIYKSNPKTGFFRRDFIEVGRKETDIFNHEYWKEHLVELAKKTVKDYEAKVGEEISRENAAEKSYREFKEWDGTV